MRDWGAPSESGFRRMLNALSRSAEYAVAAALVVVCLVVGATVWWLRSGEHRPKRVPASPATTEAPRVAEAEAERLRLEEEEAVRKLQQSLEAGNTEADRKRQLQLQAAEEALRRAEEEEARQKAAAQEAARQQAAAEAAKALAAKSAAPKKPAPAGATGGATTAAVKPAAPGTVVATAPKEAKAHTIAVVDWTTCRRPEYPERSMDRREEGTVVLSLSISAAGEVLNSKVATSSGFDALDQRALKAISRCRFKPATSDGVAEASTTTVRFAWKLGQ